METWKTQIFHKIISGLHLKTILNTSIVKINHIPVKFNVCYKVQSVNCYIPEDHSHHHATRQNCGCTLKDGHITDGYASLLLELYQSMPQKYCQTENSNLLQFVLSVRTLLIFPSILGSSERKIHDDLTIYIFYMQTYVKPFDKNSKLKTKCMVRI